MSLPRLCVDHPLAADMAVAMTPAQAHYLGGVMRLRAGDGVALFNGRDGEWRAAIEAIDRKSAHLRCVEPTRPQERVPDVWLLAAPLRKGRLEWVAEKACELGAAVLQPVQTRRSVAERVRIDRLQAICIEAAEQCGRTSVTQVKPGLSLADRLADWRADRRLLFCDETGGRPVMAALADQPRGAPWAILIGPEGGFDPDERERIRALPTAIAVSLGPRILRADTAAVTALACWQACLGDWTG